jgi:hypothetical protein
MPMARMWAAGGLALLLLVQEMLPGAMGRLVMMEGIPLGGLPVLGKSRASSR